MNISGVHFGPADLERLQNSSGPEKEKVSELARQFEAMLLRQILKEANATTMPSGLAPQSLAGDIYKDMVNNQLAEAMSHAGGFGLARALEKELSHQLPADAKPE